MPAEIGFNVTDELTQRITALAAAAGDLSPAMKDIATMLRASTVKRFETSTGPDGTAWIPSKRAIGGERITKGKHGQTLKRPYKSKPGKTLVDTGRLLASIAADSGADFAEVGTNVVYAAIHQFGGTIRPKTHGPSGLAHVLTRALNTPFGPRASVTLPARPYLGFSAEDTAGIETIIGDHLAKALQ